MEGILKRLSIIEQRLNKIEGRQTTSEDKLSELMIIIKNLVENQNNILKKDGNKFVLDKAKVYQMLDEHGYSRRNSLSELASKGVVLKDRENGNTRLTKAPDGKAKRAIVVRIEVI